MGRFKSYFGPGIFVLTALLICMSFVIALPASSKKPVFTEAKKTMPSTIIDSRMALYEKLNLDSLGLSRGAFEHAMKGYNQLDSKGRLRNDDIISILDFSLPSGKKRLFVINLETGELLFNTYVSHGRNSGQAMATIFSNQPNSYKSSLGFYVTEETYNGKNGYSLRLNGEESGFNSNALSRGIVMHSASYADESIVERQGFIGRSQGCPAVPKNVHRQIIETIKGGSCLFIYSDNNYYLSHSKLA